MTFRTTLASSAALFVLLAACKTTSSGGASDDPCSAYLDSTIAHESRCNGTGMAIEAKRDRFLAYCNRALSAPGAAPDLASQLVACGKQLETAACGDEASDCKPKGGTLTEGAACVDDTQCASGACQRAENASCGTCRASVAVGGDCTNGHCVTGSVCVSSNGKATCVAEKIAQAGESCSSENGVVRCASGLSCSFAGDKATCRAPGDTGAACSSRRDCKEGLACVSGKCAAAVAEGGACSLDECATGLGCDSTTKKCAKYKLVPDGAACDDANICETGSCSGVSADASSDGGVTVTPGKCIPVLAEGAACTPDSKTAHCDVLAECVNGKCTTPDPSACK